MLQVWQQLVGINTAMYYGPEMMLQAGFGDRNHRGDVRYFWNLEAGLKFSFKDPNCLNATWNS